MGNPEKNTQAYFDKLSQTTAGKHKKADAKFAKTPKGKRFRRAVQEKIIVKLKAAELALEQKTSKANTYYRQLGPLRAQFDQVSVKLDKANAKLERTTTENENLVAARKKIKEDHKQETRLLEKEVAELRGKLRTAQRDLNRWLLFWGWVKAHSRPGTLQWLERLWRKGPRRAPDHCWGDGQ